MIAEQLENDAPDVWKRQANSSASPATLVDEARRKYAFYPCNFCKEPFVEGTIECADEEEEGKVAPQDRMCVSCAPQPQTYCENPAQHRGHLVWKCRYCCQVANYVCYMELCIFAHPVMIGIVTNSASSAPPWNPSLVQEERELFPYPKSLDQTCHSNGPSPRLFASRFSTVLVASPMMAGLRELMRCRRPSPPPAAAGHRRPTFYSNFD
jgi:hypothetical protein